MGSLIGALSDWARVERQHTTAPRVEGRTASHAVAGEWFRCRLVSGDAGEREADGRRIVVARAELVCGPDADVKASDRLEVESVVGSGTWQVVADPRPVASRLRVRALVLTVEQVREPSVARVV